MVKFCTKTCLFILPKTSYCQLQTQSFIPFSVRQEQKILESRLVSVLHGCTHINQVKQVHAHIFRKGLEQCCFVLAKLLRTLTKLDVPMDPYPRLVFQQVEYPNPFLWTALIRGYALQGPFMESVLLYNSMRRQGIGPVSFTFTALLKACSAALDVNLGRQVHTQTILIGGFGSDLYVGNTLIDMYVKCGCLGCGHRVFDEMLDRDVISWTSLIVAYAKVGNMEAASELFDGLPMKDMVAWTAMVTGYAQNARPREALEVFERMQAAGVKTDEVTLVGVISACAQLGAAKYANWVRDVAEQSGFGPTSNFFAGDMSHPKSREIKQALEDLLDRLKYLGYQPNLSSVAYDISDEEKKRLLMSHSEKLALAFGLLTTNAGCTIRIVKNLRICEDCHSVMCGASQITGREIVVRDNMRFHHFRDGRCSCGNFCTPRTKNLVFYSQDLTLGIVDIA
ncbi:unnamed protein product, partial [Vitis vinifera]